jgi:hypothetical protein
MKYFSLQVFLLLGLSLSALISAELKLQTHERRAPLGTLLEKSARHESVCALGLDLVSDQFGLPIPRRASAARESAFSDRLVCEKG